MSKFKSDDLESLKRIKVFVEHYSIADVALLDRLISEAEAGMVTVRREVLEEACEKGLAAIDALMPGAAKIALQDYTILNEAPRAILKLQAALAATKGGEA